MNILFVCTGNTCRSPMAEGLANYLNKEFNTNVLALSVGLRAFPGMKVMPEAVTAISEKFDISEHRARQFDEKFLQAADLVITMTEDQKNFLIEKYKDDKDKIITLKEFADETGDIDDPYAHPQFVYDRCAQEIERLLRKGWGNKNFL